MKTFKRIIHFLFRVKHFQNGPFQDAYNHKMYTQHVTEILGITMIVTYKSI